MPPRADETASLTLISVLLVESGDALRRYSESDRTLSGPDLSRLADAWRGVGEILTRIAESPTTRSPEQLTDIADGIKTVRDILRGAPDVTAT